jgi:hypothetical protein
MIGWLKRWWWRLRYRERLVLVEPPAPTMTVTVEVWPIAADQTGIWLLSPDGPWPSEPIPADSEPHLAVELELIQHSVNLGDVSALHSTSWRAEHTSAILTYVAVINCPGLVRDTWPDAAPVSLELANHVGRPPTHAPTEAPAPRYVDMLYHALRHLRFLLDVDATTAAALGGTWRAHLTGLRPALAVMYSEVHQGGLGAVITAM